MRPESSQPARLHAPKVDRTGTATYNNTELIGEYLCPLACSEYKTNNCLKFPDMLKALPPLQRDEKMFHGVLMHYSQQSKAIIDYIIHKIYNEKLLKPICKKLILRRLLYKLTTYCMIQFNQSFEKQIDGCAISRDLNRSQKIVLNFHSEIRPMTAKCSKVGYPHKFIETNI